MRLRKCIFALAALAFTAAAQFPNFAPPTPLFGALIHNDAAEVQRLLADGADPNESKFVGLTPLLLALAQRNVPAARALIENGADVQAVDPAGTTTLMWAAAAEVPNAGLVEELLRRGVDPTVKNKMGETAMTWAMRRGYTAIVAALRKHGASTEPMVRHAVQTAVEALQKSGPQFTKVSGCTSCHHQSLPQMVNELARRRGITVDEAIAEKEKKYVVAMAKGYQEAMLKGTANLPNPPVTISYGMLGLAAEGHAADETTHAMAHYVASQQAPDGHFYTFTARPPMESSAISGTALSLRALQLYGKDSHERVARAASWLRQAQPLTGEERAMQLLGLVWAKANADDIGAAAQRLLAEQNRDGGWSQLDTLESDAYATGQALYALLLAGQVRAGDAAYEKAVAFLLRTQRPDGSWLVRSRSFPFQPLKDSGFPHGRDQWISAAGTSWAAMALLMSLPEDVEHISQVVR